MNGKATVVKNAGSHFLLSRLPGWEPFPAVLKGKVRLSGSDSTNPVAVGDVVEYEYSDTPSMTHPATIRSVSDRKNYLIRRSTNLSRQSHVIAANLDQAFLVVTLFFPEIKLPFLDRLLEAPGRAVLLRAMGQTLLLALLGLFFACIIGMIFGMMSVIKNKPCNVIALIFVDGIRGVPMIVLAYFIYFGIPYLLNNTFKMGMTLSALQAGTICLALNCGAYMAEIIRAGIQAVDVGQMEAARSLGLPYWKSMRRVVLPQAIRMMIPSIINQFIITLKDTSILSVIGFPELVNRAKGVVANTFMSFQTWAIVAVMYLIVILALSRCAKVLEKRLNHDR